MGREMFKNSFDIRYFMLNKYFVKAFALWVRWALNKSRVFSTIDNCRSRLNKYCNSCKMWIEITWSIVWVSLRKYWLCSEIICVSYRLIFTLPLRTFCVIYAFNIPNESIFFIVYANFQTCFYSVSKFRFIDVYIDSTLYKNFGEHVHLFCC